MKFSVLTVAAFLLAGCLQINEQIVTRADSQQINEIPDGLYCPVSSENALKDLDGMHSVCKSISWNATQQYYTTGGSRYYTMRIGDGVVLVQKRPEKSENSDWLDIAVLRITENAYANIRLENGALALASKHGINLDKNNGLDTFQLFGGNKESYFKFFRDIAKGISIDGEAVSSVDPEPNFHESLFGQVLKGGKPHSSVAGKVEQLIRFPSLTSSSSPPTPVLASSSKSSSGVETLDEILTMLGTANVRSRPSSQADKVGRLKAGAEVDVTGRTMVEGKQWYRIDQDGREAYVIGYLLSPSSAPPATAPSIYSAPSPKANVATTPAVSVYSNRFQPGTTFKDCADCPEMVVVPAGSFRMGDLSGDGVGDDDEKPVHDVTIPKAFAVGKYEVTQAEWRSVMGNNPSEFKGDRNPVENISWDDLKSFIRKLSAKTGKGYRLLSESEWEYAARARTETKYSFGNTVSSSQANYGDKIGKTSRVGQYAANAFGLHDMHGNVREWTEDCWNDSYNGARSDATARTTGGCSGRVSRVADPGTSNPGPCVPPPATGAAPPIGSALWGSVSPGRFDAYQIGFPINLEKYEQQGNSIGERSWPAYLRKLDRMDPSYKD